MQLLFFAFHDPADVLVVPEDQQHRCGQRKENDIDRRPLQEIGNHDKRRIKDCGRIAVKMETIETFFVIR